MDQENTQIKSKWLENLQRNSWELELIVSGFSIFLLSVAIEKMTPLHDVIDINFSQGAIGSVHFLLGALQVAGLGIIINLVIHIICRGYWIGMIGLSSVNAKVDIAAHNYSKSFNNRLKKGVKDINTTLKNLDNFCSVIFSFAFLFAASIISGIIYFVFLFLLLLSLNFLLVNVMWDFLSPTSFYIILYSIPGIFALLGFIYLIDFMTLGKIFKRYKLLSKFYMPIYRFCSIITFSFLYRSLYYSFINKFHKKRIALIIYPYFIGLFVLPTMYGLPFDVHNGHLLFPTEPEVEYYLDRDQYDNLRPEGNLIWYGSMNTNIVKDGSFELFIRYDLNAEWGLKRICGEDIVLHSETFSFSFDEPTAKQVKEAVDCLGEYYSVYIDEHKMMNLDYVFYEHPNRDEKGILTRINTDELEKGLHQLVIKTMWYKYYKKSDVYKEDGERAYAYFPFWVE